MNYVRLGVFATAAELDRVKEALNAPLMFMTNPEPPGPGVPHAVPMFETPHQAAHRAALAHGLPEIEGYYGLDMANGEFVRAEK